MKHSSQIGFFWHQTVLLDYFHKQTVLKVNIMNDKYILQNKSNHQCYSLLNSQKKTLLIKPFPAIKGVGIKHTCLLKGQKLNKVVHLNT